tara:strand:- start:248 stop:1966 length:1719 start_codon:yes stop_codon:yes gene_type:complete
MAMIPQYTQRASVPKSTGMQPVSLSLATSPLSGVGEGLTKAAGQLGAAAGRAQELEEAVATRVQTREDSINSQRATELFLQNEDLESEKYTKDPNTDLLTTGSVKGYVEAINQRVQQAVDSFSLSPEAKTNLFVKLSGQASIYTRAMLKKSITAQDDFSIKNAVAAARAVRIPFETLPPTADNIASEVNAVTNVIIENSSNLSSPKEREIIKQQTEKVFINGFDRVFATGDLKASEDFINSKNFRKNVTDVQLRSAISSIQTEKKERGAALRAAKMKREVFKFLVGRLPTENEALDLAEVARVPQQTRSEFKRLLNDAVGFESRLNKEDLANNSEYQLIKKRIELLTKSKDGLNISFGPDGRLRTLTQGGGGGVGSGLRPSQALDQKAQVDSLETTVSALNKLIGQIETDKSTAGLIGSIKSISQKFIGIAEDSAPEEFRLAISRTADVFGLSTYFDEKLPEQEIYQNTIALQLAKLRVSSGGSQNPRAMKLAFDIARDDMALRGLTSSKEVLARLKTIRTEFNTERAKLVKRLSGSSSENRKSEYDEGSIVTNSTTGQRLITRNGFWVPLL